MRCNVHRWGKCAAAAALALALMLGPAVLPLAEVQAASLSELQERQEALEEQQQAKAAELQALKEDRDQQQAYADALEEQMTNLENQIDNLNGQINSLNASITQKEGEISATQTEIEEDYDILRERLRAMYLAGEATTLQVILNSENVVDFMQKAEVMQAITEHDTELIAGLWEKLESIQEEKDAIEQERAQTAQAKEDLDAKSRELSAMVEESHRVLAELNANVVETNSENNELARRLAEADAAVDQWYADYYASLPSNDTTNSASGGYASTGNFTWPVPGYTYLTSYWGDGRNHKGIDIAGSGIYGKPIVAADSGKVIQAVHSGWGGGYGLCVYLDHGNGYSTRYGHMSQVLVNVGDVVQKGQVIGYVGSTGDSSGPHLHFEIRINGVAQDPMQWFR